MEDLNLFQAVASPLDTEGAPDLPSSGFAVPHQRGTYRGLDLNHELVVHPESTFYVRVEGTAMAEADINDGDILIVDKSRDIVSGELAVCIVNHEYLVRYVDFHPDHVLLSAANANVPPITIGHDEVFSVWGVVTYIIKKVNRRKSQ